MPRPLVIEYNHAFYHVMNRGKGRNIIFHDDKYYIAFLKSVEEVYERFGAVVHCYCLMGNHYHLLLETPGGDISRVMRHINGTYTQRYNRLFETDGPLFRGRYKAILVDSDNYLLQLNRYIHKNSLALKVLPEEYKWSSCSFYTGKYKPPKWLDIHKTLSMLGGGKTYLEFLASEINPEIESFYNKKKIAGVLGGALFKEKILESAIVKARSQKQIVRGIKKLTMDEIIKEVAQVFDICVNDIVAPKKGNRTINYPRKFAMFICQERGGFKLKEIAEFFSIKNASSVGNATYIIRKKIESGEFEREFDRLKNLKVIKVS